MPEFLRKALESSRTVKVFTTNGAQMNGLLLDVDMVDGFIILEVKGKEHFIFMSAISTIV